VERKPFFVGGGRETVMKKLVGNSKGGRGHQGLPGVPGSIAMAIIGRLEKQSHVETSG